jgi:serine O-acetyltransferase
VPRRSFPSRVVRTLLWPFVRPDYTWKFLTLLRKAEYYENCGRSLPAKAYWRLLKRRLFLMQVRLGFSIWPNTVGPGLCLPHIGPILIHWNCSIGSHFTVNIGAVIGTNTAGETPTIGDNVVVEPGAKIFGAITLANNIVVGANSVVNKSFTEENISIAGVPARKIKDAGAIERARLIAEAQAGGQALSGRDQES